MNALRGRWWRTGLLVAFAVAAVACGGSSNEDPESEGLPHMRHYLGLNPSPGSSPWFIGVEKGFFRDAGVDVEVLGGETPSAGPGLLAAGDAETASTDFTFLALTKAEEPDLPAKLIAIHHQHSIDTIYSLRSNGNIDSPEDLEGMTIVARTGAFAPDIIEAWAEENGYPVPKFQEVDPDAVDRLLISGRADATTSAILSRGELLGAAEEAGEELVIFPLADHGLDDFYGTGISVNTDFAAENPDAVRAFLEGMKASFEWAFANKEEAAAFFSERYPTYPPEIVVSSLETLEEITSDGGTVEFGTIEESKVDATLEVVEKAFGIDLDSDDMYTTEYQAE